jgi:hypothetical protein
VAAASEAGEEPEDLQLKKVLPVLYDKITLMHQDLKQSVKLAVSEIVKKTQTTHETAFAGEFQAAVQDFGRRTFTVQSRCRSRQCSWPVGSAA